MEDLARVLVQRRRDVRRADVRKIKSANDIRRQRERMILQSRAGRADQERRRDQNQDGSKKMPHVPPPSTCIYPPLRSAPHAHARVKAKSRGVASSRVRRRISGGSNAAPRRSSSSIRFGSPKLSPSTMKPSL